MRSCLDSIGVILGLGFMGIMDKKMETTIMGSIGFGGFRDLGN